MLKRISFLVSLLASLVALYGKLDTVPVDKEVVMELIRNVTEQLSALLRGEPPPPPTSISDTFMDTFGQVQVKTPEMEVKEVLTEWLSQHSFT